MKVVLFIGGCIVIGLTFYWLGRAIGDYVGKKQKFQNEVKRNGSKHI